MRRRRWWWWRDAGLAMPAWPLLALSQSRSSRLAPARRALKELANARSWGETKSPSSAGFHLGGGALRGRVLALGLAGGSLGAAERRLRDWGVETNRVDGKWTGVSLARFMAVVNGLREGGELALHVYLRIAALACGADDVQAREAFVRGLEEHAAHLVGAVGEEEEEDDLRTLTLDVAKAMHVSSVKPGVKVVRHPVMEGVVVPDCVEVVCREMVDFLVFDMRAGRYDVRGRLPESALPEVRAFFEDLAAGRESVNVNRRWFDLCQNLPPQVGAEYLCYVKESGFRYELMPSADTVARVVHWFLFGTALSRHDGDPVQAVCAKWSKASGRCLAVRSRVQLVRPALSEETVRREMVELDMGEDTPVMLEMCLERQHRLASVRFLRSATGKDVEHRRVAPAARLTGASTSLLNYSLLSETIWDTPMRTCEDLDWGVLCTRWERDSRHPWFEPYGGAERTAVEQAVQDRMALSHLVKALHAVRSVALVQGGGGGVPVDEYVSWLMRLNAGLVRRFPTSWALRAQLARFEGLGVDHVALVKADTGVDLSRYGSSALRGWVAGVARGWW